MKRIAIVLIAASMLGLMGCDRQTTVQKTESIMGTDVTITVVAPSAGKGEVAIDAAMEELRRLDRMMSLYKDGSEITRVNLAAGEHSVTVSREMIEVVEHARRISELSGGAFDATIGPLVVLWQMKLKEGAVPSDREIKAVLTRVDYRDILIDKKGPTIFLTRKGMILDLGGAAKGYASDRAISTSGDYERFTIVNKKRFHHILDPRTGKPSEGTESVTVIGDQGAVLDPLTTALFVLGPEKGMQLVKDLGYEAIFVDDKGTVLTTEGIDVPR